VAETYFDEWAARNYARLWPELCDPDVLNSTIDFLADLCPDGSALEFGTGRVALRLTERGISVAAIELSQAMVHELRGQGGAENRGSRWDLATTTIPGGFSLVYLVRNTITNLATQDEQIAAFTNAAAHLDPGGCLVDVGWLINDLTTWSDRSQPPRRSPNSTTRWTRARRQLPPCPTRRCGWPPHYSVSSPARNCPTWPPNSITKSLSTTSSSPPRNTTSSTSSEKPPPLTPGRCPPRSLRQTLPSPPACSARAVWPTKKVTDQRGALFVRTTSKTIAIAASTVSAAISAGPPFLPSPLKVGPPGNAGGVGDRRPGRRKGRLPGTLFAGATAFWRSACYLPSTPTASSREPEPCRSWPV
jgi:hypothetical protein